jgi:hypothetical protein
LGFLLSSFFTIGFWRFAPAYDAPTQILFILFAVLAFLTVLALVERKTVVAVVKLVALTFSFSVLFHQLIPNEQRLSQTQSLLAHYVPATPSIGLNSRLVMTEVVASSLLDSLPDGVSPIARITRPTQLYEERKGVFVPSPQSADGGVWRIVDPEPIEIHGERYVQVRLQEKGGSSSDLIRYVPESAVGLKVLIPVGEGG